MPPTHVVIEKVGLVKEDSPAVETEAVKLVNQKSATIEEKTPETAVET